ncbi:MAG: hypothetical protein WCA77_04580, partial [Thermoplasmata archaeon]
MAAAAMSAPAVPPMSTHPSPRGGSLSDKGVVLRGSIRAERWIVRGTAKVEGDVDVGSLDVSGLLSIRGKLTVGEGRIVGRAEVDGPTEVARSLYLQGIHHFDAAVTAGALQVKGDNEVMGAVTIQNGFASQGKLVVNGPLHAAALDFEGRLVAKEWVADRIEGRLKGESSRATSIRAAVIRIVRGSWTGSR